MYRPENIFRSIVVAGATSLSPTVALATTYEDIQVLDKRIEPLGNLTSRGDGHFYGVSGSTDKTGGQIYRFAPDQGVEILFTFEAPDEEIPTNRSGSDPLSPLIVGPDGTFYGTTEHGGAFGSGTIFRWSPDGVFGVLHDINPSTEGYRPWKLIIAPTGDLLGIMGGGGPKGAGTIFRLSLDGTFQTIHAFESPLSYPPGTPVPPDARFEPASPLHLAIGPDGAVYGTTSIGGPVKAFGLSRITYGTFFRLEDTGDITVLAEFHPYKEEANSLTPTADGFIAGNRTSLLHIGLDGTIQMEADFSSLPGPSVWPRTPLATSHGIYGSTVYGGGNGAGFIHYTPPTGGTSNVHDFPASFRYSRVSMGEGHDGLVYGVANLAEGTTSPLPRVFRLHEGATSPNFVPVAAPDVAWLPIKTKTGKREIIIDILANDQDPDSDPLTVTSLGGDLGAGSAEIVPTPQGARLKFSTQEAAPASRVITYQLSDGQGGVSTGYVAIQSPVNGRFLGKVSGGSISNAPLDVKFDKSNQIKVTFALNGIKYKGSGRLDASDAANVTLVAKGQPLLNLHLVLQRGPSASLEATIRNGEADLHATCTAFGGK